MRCSQRARDRRENVLGRRIEAKGYADPNPELVKAARRLARKAPRTHQSRAVSIPSLSESIQMKTLDPQPLVDVARTVANFRRQTFDYNDDEREEARLFLRMLYAAWPPWQYAEAGVVAALVAVGFTHVEAAELAIALGELRKGKDRRVTQLIATLSARYHSASSEQAAVPRGEAA